MSAADRVAVDDLLVGYFRGFDERRTDDAFLRATFTGDAHWRFPRGDATGIEEIIERRDGTLGLWKETLHSAARTDAGWRLRRLGLDLVWTDGDPPGQTSG